MSFQMNHIKPLTRSQPVEAQFPVSMGAQLFYALKPLAVIGCTLQRSEGLQGVGQCWVDTKCSVAQCKFPKSDGG